MNQSTCYVIIPKKVNNIICKGLTIMRFPLKRKFTLLIVIVIVSISAATILTCANLLNNTITKHYTDYSIDLAKTVAVTVDAERTREVRDKILEIYRNTDNRVSSDKWGTPEFDDYIARYSEIEKSADFILLKAQLRKIQDVNHVDSVYLIYSDQVSEASIYVADAAHQDSCPPGCFDPYFEDDYALADDPDKGIAPVVTNTGAYGWIVTTGMPVYDNSGDLVAYANVDISMSDIITQQWKLILIMVGLILVFSVVFSLIGIYLVNRFIINPIKKLTEISQQYYSADSAVIRHRFSELDIHTGDEIEALAEAMAKMEDDIDVHINNLITTTRELASANTRADKLNMIASLDALTSVQNKRAYYLKTDQLDEDIKNGTASFGIIVIDMNDLKRINDTYGHEKGDISIKTLSMILNKIFKHSSIFRIGGDEFAIILEGNYHTHAQGLLRTLDEKLNAVNSKEDLEPWERISAAVGYADYDAENDPDVDTVFKRADQSMYENKQFIKKQR